MIVNRWSVAIQNAPLILRGAYEYNIASRWGPLPAREWLFPVTYRCDARCIMCNIWQSPKGAELSLQQWEQVLDDPLFASIESISLTGGEPTLRRDLPELAQLLLGALPSLRRLTVTTNALRTEHVTDQCRRLLELCLEHKTAFFVGVSLDGVGRVHDEMRGVAGAFESVQLAVEQLQGLQSRGLRLGINCTLTRQNFHDARNVQQWCARQGLEVNFIIASFAEGFYSNVDAEGKLGFASQGKAELLAFLDDLARARSPGKLGAYFYSDIARMIRDGTPRSTPCVFQKDGFMLDGRGDLQYCMYSQKLGNVLEQRAGEIYRAPHHLAHREEIIASRCPNCTISCFLELGLAKDAFKYLRFLLGRQP